MALPVAPLGSLPSMNLGHGGGTMYVEPAWHKALTAFLVNTAGSTGKDLVSNALARDYSTAATAQGLPGATSPTTGDQSFWSKVLHGPEWDKERYKEAQQMKVAQERDKATEAYRAKELGLRELGMQTETAQRAQAAAERADEFKARTEHERAMEDRLNRALASEQAFRDRQLAQAAEQFGRTENRQLLGLQLGHAGDLARLEATRQEHAARAPLTAAQIDNLRSEIQARGLTHLPEAKAVQQLQMARATLPEAEFQRMFPNAAAIEQQYEQAVRKAMSGQSNPMAAPAANVDELRKMFQTGGSLTPGATNSTTDTAVRPVTSNNETINRSASSPTVPGSAPVDSMEIQLPANLRPSGPVTTPFAIPSVTQGVQSPDQAKALADALRQWMMSQGVNAR